LVTIRFEPMGAIIHPAYSIKADLRCALRFGIDEYFFQEKLHRKTRFLSTLLYYLKAGFGKDPIIHAYSLLWYSHQIIGYWRFRLFYPKSGLDL